MTPYPARLLALCAVTLVPGACISRSPGPEDFLRAGHRTPERTLDTFRDALACDLPDLEYRCLSSAFRSRLGVSRLSYGEARDELPFYRQLADSEIVETEVLGPDRVAMTAVLDHAFGEEWFRLELVREDFVELWAGDEPIVDELADFNTLVHSDNAGRLRAEAPLQGLPADIVTEVRIGRDWKIDSFGPIEAPTEASERPASP